MPKRPAIPWRVVLAAAIRQAGGSIPCAETGDPITALDAYQGEVERDHNPPLSQRKYNDELGEYTPDANDPEHIDLVSKKGHRIRTNQRRGLNRGDQTENAHRKRLVRKEGEHADRMASKIPGQKRKPKGTIKSRGFNKSVKRKIRATGGRLTKPRYSRDER